MISRGIRKGSDMEIILKCEECDSLLDGDINEKGQLYVSLCPACEKRIREEAEAKGYADGKEE